MEVRSIECAPSIEDFPCEIKMEIASYLKWDDVVNLSLTSLGFACLCSETSFLKMMARKQGFEEDMKGMSVSFLRRINQRRSHPPRSGRMYYTGRSDTHGTHITQFSPLDPFP